MKLAGAALLSLAAATMSAHAQDIVDATAPHRLLESFEKFGTAQLTADDTGDPLIRGSMEGINYVVFFYGCASNAACKSLTFTASWDVDDISQETINEWNRTKRFGKAYLDEEDDPNLQMSVNLDFGVTAENFEDTVDWWRVAVGQFRDEVINQ